MVVNFDRQAYNAGLLLPTKAEKMKQGYQIGPPWLRPLLTAQFFNTCEVHGDSNRNECNLYCLDCRGEALCSGCTAQHRDHHVVQIRRSSYHDVVRVSELQKVLDLTGVQTYIINSARVVFLNARPQPRHAKGVTKTCEICDRSLLDTFRYCSLGCKLTGIRRHNDMTFHLQPKNKQEQQEQGNPNQNNNPEEHQQNQQQQQQVEEEKSSNMAENPLAPPLPARSSITSEDTGSSGGVSGHSKRTRSSRIKSSPPHNSGADSGFLFRSSIADDLAAPHNTKHTNHHKPQHQNRQDHQQQQQLQQQQQQQSLKQEHQEQQQQQQDHDIFLRTTLIQRSLGTLKLGRPSQQQQQQQQSSCVSLEMDQSDQIVHHPGSPAAVSSSSIAGTGLSELSPPTPPPTRTAKRRKGTPHRAPLGM